MPPDLGRGRHSGLLVPLFSMPSSASWGIGETLDLPIFARWLREAGQDLLQILPIHEMAPGQRSPYNAVTAMAIDPLYISLRGVDEFAEAGGEQALSADARDALRDVRQSPAVEHDRVRAIKNEALRLAYARFERRPAREFDEWAAGQAWWLDEYSVFRALHAAQGEAAWTEWPADLQSPDGPGVTRARHDLSGEIRYYQYLQWTADRQWRQARRESDIALVGDLPFMVDLDSADVWAHRELFELDAQVGVPPDAFSATGQKWGVPVYRWQTNPDGVDAWLRARARRAAALYDGYRIDHLVGFYRTYFIRADDERQFRPPDEASQLAQGERLLALFREQGPRILAEDLGTVPDFVRESMARLGVPGYRVFRWEREWHEPGQPFRDPRAYPPLSVATSGTHDTEPAIEWWDHAPADERREVARLAVLSPAFDGLDPAQAAYTPALRDALLEILVASGSNFLVLPIQDLFGWRERINVPAHVDDRNWTWRLPWPSDAFGDEPDARERAARLREWCRSHGR